MPTPEDVQRALETIRRVREQGGFNPERPYRPPDDTWKQAYAAEHGGRAPGEVPGESELEAIANLLWSQDFARMYGRGPSQAEWVAHWQDYSQGRDPTWKSYLEQAKTLSVPVPEPPKPTGGSTATASDGYDIPPPPQQGGDDYGSIAGYVNNVFGALGKALSFTPFGGGFDRTGPTTLDQNALERYEQQFRRRVAAEQNAPSGSELGREFLRQEGHFADVNIPPPPATRQGLEFIRLEGRAADAQQDEIARLRQEWETSDKSLLRNLVEQIAGGVWDTTRTNVPRIVEEIASVDYDPSQSFVGNYLEGLKGKGRLALDVLGTAGNYIQALGDPTASLLRAGVEEFRRRTQPTTEERLAEVSSEYRRLAQIVDEGLVSYNELGERDRRLLELGPQEFLLEQDALDQLRRMPVPVNERTLADMKERMRGRQLAMSEEFQNRYDWTTLMQYGTGNILPSILDDPRRLDTYFEALARTGNRLEAQQEAESILSELPAEILTDPFDLYGYVKGGRRALGAILARAPEQAAEDVAERATREALQQATQAVPEMETEGLVGAMSRRQAQEAPQIVSSIDTQTRLAQIFREPSPVQEAFTDLSEYTLIDYAPTQLLENAIVAFAKQQGVEDAGSSVRRLRELFAEEFIEDPQERRLFLNGNKGVIEKYGTEYRKLLTETLFGETGYRAPIERWQTYSQRYFERAMKSKVPEANPKRWVSDLAAAFTRVIRHPERFTPEKVVEYLNSLRRIRSEIERLSAGTYTIDYEWVVRSGEETVAPTIKGVKIKIVPTELWEDVSNVPRRAAREVAETAPATKKAAREAAEDDVYSRLFQEEVPETPKKTTAPEAPTTTKQVDEIQPPVEAVPPKPGDAPHSTAARSETDKALRKLQKKIDTYRAVYGEDLPREAIADLQQAAREAGTLVDSRTGRLLEPDEYMRRSELLEKLLETSNVDPANDKYGNYARFERLVMEILPQEMVEKLLDATINTEGKLPKKFFPKGVVLPDWAVPFVDAFGVPMPNGKLPKFIREYMTEARRALYGGSPWPGHVVQYGDDVGIIARMRRQADRLRAQVILFNGGKPKVITTNIENLRYLGELQRENWEEIAQRVSRKDVEIPEPRVNVDSPEPLVETPQPLAATPAERIEETPSFVETFQRAVEEGEIRVLSAKEAADLRAEAHRLDLEINGRIPENAMDDAFLRPQVQIEGKLHPIFDGTSSPLRVMRTESGLDVVELTLRSGEEEFSVRFNEDLSGITGDVEQLPDEIRTIVEGIVDAAQRYDGDVSNLTRFLVGLAEYVANAENIPSALEAFGHVLNFGIDGAAPYRRLIEVSEDLFHETASVLLGQAVENPKTVRVWKERVGNFLDFWRDEVRYTSEVASAPPYRYTVLRDVDRNVLGVVHYADAAKFDTLSKLDLGAEITPVVDDVADAAETVAERTTLQTVQDFVQVIERLEEPPTQPLNKRLKRVAERFSELQRYTWDSVKKRWVTPDGSVYEYKLPDGRITHSMSYEASKIVAELRDAIASSLSEEVKRRIQRTLPNWIPVEKTDGGWRFARTRPPTNSNAYQVVGEVLDEADFAEKILANAIEISVDRARLSPVSSDLLTVSMYDEFIEAYSRIVGPNSMLVRQLKELRRPFYESVRESVELMLKNVQDALKIETTRDVLTNKIADESFNMTYKGARRQLTSYMELFTKLYGERFGIETLTIKKAAGMVDLWSGYKSGSTALSGLGFLYNPVAGRVRATWRWIGVGSTPLRRGWRQYQRLRLPLIQGLVGAVGIGIAYTTPMGDVLIERDENGRLQGFIPDAMRMFVESVGTQLRTDREGRFSWVSTLWDTSMAFFQSTATWSNMSAGLFINTMRAHGGGDDWVSKMLMDENLTDDQRQALLYAHGVAFSGEEAVKAAYEEILALGRQPTYIELEAIYERHRDPLRDFVGTLVFDPLYFLNGENLFKTGTGAVGIVQWKRTGELPEYVGMGYREFAQWRNAQRLLDAGDTKSIWNVLFEKKDRLLYPAVVKVARAQRRADMLIEAALGSFPFDLNNYQQAVNIIFQELAAIGGDAAPIIRAMDPDRMAKAIGSAIAKASSDELEQAEFLREIILRTARQLSRDAAYEVLGVSRKTESLKTLRGIARFQKAALSRLLLNSLNFGFHITNTLGDIGTTLILGAKMALAPEADGYLSLFNIRRMHQFFEERFGLVPSVVNEAFDVLGEEKTHTLFGRTPILNRIPGLNRIPQPETLSAVRVYTMGVAHWFPRFYHAGVDAVVEPVLRDVGIEQPDLVANIALAIKGAWKEEDIRKNVLRVLRQYGYDATDAARLSNEIAGNMSPVLWRARAAALAGADELRKQTIHQYWRKGYADSVIELFFPYQYWYSRGLLRWTTGIAENPSILSNYYKFERLMIDGLNGNLNDPEYMQRNPSLPTSANPYLGDAVASMMDQLVIALYPDITPENVSTEAVYVNAVEKMMPIRNLYRVFGSEYDPITDKYDANIVTNLVTAGGRFGPALSPLAPLLAAGLGRVLGKDVTNIKYLIEPTAPFAQDRILQGLSLRAEDLIEEMTGDENTVGVYGWTMTPKYREIISNMTAALSGQGDADTFWGYSMPDYYYKETARRIAEAVHRGDLTTEEALQLIRDQDVSDPRYREYLREAAAYYANRGDVSAIFGILARYDVHTDVRDLRNQLYDMALVRDENGNPLIDESGNLVWNFEHPNVVAFMRQYPAAAVFATASKEWIERQANAATSLIWNYASDYTRRQFSLAWRLRAAQVNPDIHTIKSDPEQLQVWMQYLEGKLPSTLLQRFQAGEATPADTIAVSRELDKFRLVFTNPELEQRRMEVEAMIDMRVQKRYPRYALLNSLYWWLRTDQNNPRAAQIFLENNQELAEAWEFRRQLADETGLFPVTPTERAFYNLVDPPSESQRSFALAIGYDPEKVEEATSQELSTFIATRKREAMQIAGIESDVELEYIQSQAAKAEDIGDFGERERLLRALLTPEQYEKWQAYKDALYIGNFDYRGTRLLLAIDLGMPSDIARQASPETIERFIETRYAYARAAAGLTREEVDALQDLASERGWDVLTKEEQTKLQAYYDALGKARPITKDRIELAMELGLSASEARTITAEALEDFIDRRFDEIAREKAAKQANFNNAAQSVGFSPEQMSNVIDLKNAKGWDELTIGEGIALQRFYLAYYGNHPDPDKRTYATAFYKALQEVGATEDQIVVLLARKKVFGWNSLSRSEKNLLRRFENLWDAYD